MKQNSNSPLAGLPTTLPGIMLVVATYGLIHATTRLMASGNLGNDDPLENIAIQTLSLGYSLDYGPLYNWLLWLMQQLLGAHGLLSFLLVKYVMLVLLACGVFSITRRLTNSPFWAFTSVASMAAVYQIFWRFHEGLTHRAGAIALTVATLWILLRLIDRPSTACYALFAAVLGLGLLSEHTYAVFVISLLAAAWSQPSIRRTLFSPSLFVMLPITAAIVSPYVWWLFSDPLRPAAFIDNLLPPVPSPSIKSAIKALRNAMTFPIYVLSPWLLIALAMFPKVFRTVFRPASTESPDLKSFLGRLLLIEVVLLIVFNGFVFAKTGYPVHSLLPMMVVAIPWLTAKIHETAPSENRARIYVLILLAFVFVIYGIRVGNLFVYEPFCSRCRWGTPYDGLAERLRDDFGFVNGTIVTNDLHTGGNLRRFFPESHIIVGSLPIDSVTGRQVAQVWLMPHGKDAPLPEPASGNQPVHFLEVPWRPPLKPAGYRHTTWAVCVSSQP